MDCPACEEKMFFTGEQNPTTIPQRYYACVNKHIRLIYNDRNPDWGDGSITREWRQALNRPGGIDEYKMV